MTISTVVRIAAAAAIRRLSDVELSDRFEAACTASDRVYCARGNGSRELAAWDELIAVLGDELERRRDARAGGDVA